MFDLKRSYMTILLCFSGILFLAPTSGDTDANSPVISNRTVPTLWINGKPQRLSDCKGNWSEKNSYRADALSVFVSGKDVYVAGYEEDSAMLWKNGKPQHLKQERKYGYSYKATSVFLSGKDVYVAGSVGRYGDNGDAILWKNGEPQDLQQSSVKNIASGKSFYVEANSVYVSGKDVYVAGTATIIDTKNGYDDFGILWKNGKPQFLYDEDSLKRQHASSVFQLDGNVYVAGNQIKKRSPGSQAATLWKNGTQHFYLTDGKREASISEVIATKNIVYAVGYEYNEGGGLGDTAAMLWKIPSQELKKAGQNTQQISFETQRLSAEKYSGLANSIFVIGEDVYVAGRDRNASGRWATTVWKNGKVIHQHNIEAVVISEAKSIFVSSGDIYVAGHEIIDNNKG
ncbi:MAG: hypothetical protein FWG02_00440 [Holophagaceae bacterium]|nr:hypothetical protein [Holophagaceae bacterium]